MRAESITDELLTRVISTPGDDAPRLAYADHLSEKGDPRGEFIRAQLALERAGSPLERARQEARSHQLLCLHGERWLAELGDWCLSPVAPGERAEAIAASNRLDADVRKTPVT